MPQLLETLPGCTQAQMGSATHAHSLLVNWKIIRKVGKRNGVCNTQLMVYTARLADEGLTKHKYAGSACSIG